MKKMSKLSIYALLIASLFLPEIIHSAETQLYHRARRCICISISCGCYQPSNSVYRQPLPSSYRQQLPSQYRQTMNRQQPDQASCFTECLQECMQNQQNSCQKLCQNSCSGAKITYQQQRGNAPISYQYEPIAHEIVTGQQSGSGACTNVCMPSCESQCIQRSTSSPILPQHNGPIPVVQSQSPSYYPSRQYEPAMQQYSDNDHTICIHLCMPSCESQCIERTTPSDYQKPTPYSPGIDYPKPASYSPGIDYPKPTSYSPGIDYPRPTPYPSGIDYPKQTSFPPLPYQNFAQANQTSIVILPYQKSGTTTICLPVCSPTCQTQCAENQGQIGAREEYGTTIEEPIVPTQIDLLPHEISISLPQSIQQSPNCMNLCHDTCMQQCVGQNQPADQCRPSCSYTCQESCPQSAMNIDATNSAQQLQTESEIYETIPPPPDNSINPSLFKTFRLRSPPYYSRKFYHESPVDDSSIINCPSGLARTGQCNCPAGYIACLSTKPRAIQQKCCRKRR